MRKSVVALTVVHAIIWVALVVTASMSPTMLASGPYIHPFGSFAMWVAAASLAAVLIAPAIAYASGLRWMRFVLAVVHAALLIVAIALLGLMIVLVLFHSGGEGWFIMGFDWWYLATALLAVVEVIAAFFWFRVAFSGRREHHDNKKR